MRTAACSPALTSKSTRCCRVLSTTRRRPEVRLSTRNSTAMNAGTTLDAGVTPSSFSTKAAGVCMPPSSPAPPCTDSPAPGASAGGSGASGARATGLAGLDSGSAVEDACDFLATGGCSSSLPHAARPPAAISAATVSGAAATWPRRNLRNQRAAGALRASDSPLVRAPGTSRLSRFRRRA